MISWNHRVSMSLILSEKISPYVFKPRLFGVSHFMHLNQHPTETVVFCYLRCFLLSFDDNIDYITSLKCL